MTDIKSGLQTSEFKVSSLIALLTTFGDKLSIFDISAFAEDPQLMLIYRGVQLIALAAVAVTYILGRSRIKEIQQAPAPLIMGEAASWSPQNKTSREG